MSSAVRCKGTYRPTSPARSNEGALPFRFLKGWGLSSFLLRAGSSSLRFLRAMRSRKRRALGQRTLNFPTQPANYGASGSGGITTSMPIARRKCERSLEYIHANPIQRRLVTHPRDWPWSSWTFYACGEGLLQIDSLGSTWTETDKKETKEQPTLSKTERVGHPPSLAFR